MEGTGYRHAEEEGYCCDANRKRPCIGLDRIIPETEPDREKVHDKDLQVPHALSQSMLALLDKHTHAGTHSSTAKKLARTRVCVGFFLRSHKHRPCCSTL